MSVEVDSLLVSLYRVLVVSIDTEGVAEIVERFRFLWIEGDCGSVVLASLVNDLVQVECVTEVIMDI